MPGKDDITTKQHVPLESEDEVRAEEQKAGDARKLMYQSVAAAMVLNNENEKLKSEIEKLNKSLVTKDEEIKNSASLKKQSDNLFLEQKKELVRLFNTNIRLGDEKINFQKELSGYKQQNENLSKQLDELSLQLSFKITEANRLLKKSKQKRLGLAILLFILGALLTITGVGAVSGVSMVILGYLAFSVGVAVIVPEFLSFAYHGLRQLLGYSTHQESIQRDPINENRNELFPQSTLRNPFATIERIPTDYQNEAPVITHLHKKADKASSINHEVTFSQSCEV